MKIISHRGLWYNPVEKNTESSLIESFINKLGTETDIRDFNSKLVISHDISNQQCITIDKLFKIYSNSKYTLALNIKSDGLSDLLLEKIKEYNISDYFVFDMSIPDTLSYLKLRMNVFIRISEFEKESELIEMASGLWVDTFSKIWYDEKTLSKYLDLNKTVCLVSPELHKRNKYELWEKLSKMKLIKNNNLILCTDEPLEAIKYFNLVI